MEMTLTLPEEVAQGVTKFARRHGLSIADAVAPESAFAPGNCAGSATSGRRESGPDMAQALNSSAAAQGIRRKARGVFMPHPRS